MIPASPDRPESEAPIRRLRRGELDLLRLEGTAATIEITAHGAHLSAWNPRGQRPVLFLSPKAVFAPGKAIRGGVPIVFPWFGARPGDPKSPAHGFARTENWTTRTQHIDARGQCIVEMTLTDDAATRASWDHFFEATFRVVAGERLHLSLLVVNRGTRPMPFEAAFHTYFAVSDVRGIAIHGLENTEYLDKPSGMSRQRQPAEPIRFAGEVDRVYVNTEAPCSIVDPGWRRRIEVRKSGSRATVVWNPWEKTASAMSDLGADQWPHMVCVESAIAAENALVLAPGGGHTLETTIEVAAI